MLASAADSPLPFVSDHLAALRVFVADDHALYRQVVVRAIEQHPDLILVGEASDGTSALAAINETAPQVALLDLRMPGLDGLELCQHLRASRPDLAVVILTAFDDETTPARAALAGAHACLGKDASETGSSPRAHNSPEDEPAMTLTPDTPLVSVVIADDHPLYRDALARTIAWHPQLELVGEATDGPTALALIESLVPDVAVVDLHMPRLSGLQVCEHLQHADPPSRTAVLILTAFLSTELFAEAVRVGAAGYVGKDAARDDLAEAIANVGTGGRAFSDWGGPESLWPVTGRAGHSLR